MEINSLGLDVSSRNVKRAGRADLEQALFGIRAHNRTSSAAEAIGNIGNSLDSFEMQLQGKIGGTPATSQPAPTTDTPFTDNGWRNSMPGGLATDTILEDIQLADAWFLYSWAVPSEQERVSPSEFLRKLQSITPEELANSEQKVTPKQTKGLRDFYKLQAGNPTFENKTVDRAIDLYNRMFAAGLIEHSPVVDINIGMGFRTAEWGPNGEVLIVHCGKRTPLSDLENAARYAQYITDFPEQLVPTFEPLVNLAVERMEKSLEVIKERAEVENESVLIRSETEDEV